MKERFVKESDGDEVLKVIAKETSCLKENR